MPADARPAATIVLLTEGPSGLETLLLKRSGGVGFFPHAWVFPGGRVDAADATVALEGGGPSLVGHPIGLEEAARPSAVAAARECFEEAGVWLGRDSPGDDLRDALNARSATLLDAGSGPTLHLDRLHTWARWVTPEVEPRRYDTWFFLAAVSPEEALEAVHDAGELVESAWVPLSEAIERQDPQTFFLAPPTFRTIEELARARTLSEAMALAAARPRVPVMPRLDKGTTGWTVVLPGDPSYPSDTPVAGPTRITWRTSRWVSEWGTEPAEAP